METSGAFWDSLSERSREHLKTVAAQKEQRRINSKWRKQLKALVARLHTERGGCCEICKTPSSVETLRLHYRDYVKAQHRETPEDIFLLCSECYKALHKRIVAGKLTEEDARFLPPGAIILYGRIVHPRKRKEKGHVEKDRVRAYRREQIKKVSGQIADEKGIVTSVDLASAMDVAPRTARSYIKWLVSVCEWVETSASARSGGHHRGGRRALAAKRRSPCSS